MLIRLGGAHLQFRQLLRRQGDAGADAKGSPAAVPSAAGELSAGGGVSACALVRFIKLGLPIHDFNGGRINDCPRNGNPDCSRRPARNRGRTLLRGPPRAYFRYGSTAQRQIA